MALDDFIKGVETSSSFKAFNYHELDKQLEEMVEEAQSRFPEEVDVEFIEASPQLQRYSGKAYKDYDDEGHQYVQYIRIKKNLAEKNNAETKRVVLHEMAHVYLYQKGLDHVTEKDVTFQWLCGRVMADPSDVFEGSKEWDRVIEPMLEMEGEL